MTCSQFPYIPVYLLLQLLQLIHHLAQDIEVALPDFYTANVHACIGKSTVDIT